MEALFQLLPHALGLEVFDPSSCVVWNSPTFCEYVDFVPSSLDRLSNNLLCSSPTVKRRSVYPVHSNINCCLDGFDGNFLILWSPVDFPFRRRAYLVQCPNSDLSDS